MTTNIKKDKITTQKAKNPICEISFSNIHFPIQRKITIFARVKNNKE